MSSSDGSGNGATNHQTRNSSPRKNKSLLKPALTRNKDGKKTSAPVNVESTRVGGKSTQSSTSVAPNEVTTDGESNDVGRSLKPGGRLKFFKDGVLCLELSHHDEGAKTKWVQIRTKTVFPAIVHTTKEATIPCHSTPSFLSSPSGTQNSRMESSTSHSMSDDGSSMLSSPRLRESTWKQSVPLKGVSACHEFFMKPAQCILKYRKTIIFKARRPFCLPVIDGIHFECSCSDFVVQALNNTNETANDKNTNETDADSKPLSNNANTLRVKCNSPLDLIVKKLETVAESRYSVSKLNNSCNKSVLKTPLTTPKKRVLTVSEAGDSNFRPKKKSPLRNIEKTILTIPGLNSEFYKRHSSLETNDLPSSVCSDGSSKNSGKVINLSKSINRIKSRSNLLSQCDEINNSGNTLLGSGRNSRYLGAKSSTSKYLLNTPELANKTSMLIPSHVVKSAISMPKSGGKNSLMPKIKNKTSVQQQKEQQFFQQQTMSKAISYTINSLLGTGSSNQNNSHAKLIKNIHNGKVSSAKKSVTKCQSSEKNKAHSKSSNNNNDQHSGVDSKVGSFGENDQNSFLRHLLDTSDPIPSNKNERSAIIQSKSPKSNSSNHIGSLGSNHTSTDSKSSTTTQNATKPVSSNSSRSSSPLISNHKVRHSSHSQSMPGVGCDLYGSLFRPTNSTAALAAAAAAFHYGSLLPAAFLPHLSTSPVAAASYLIPHPSISTTSPSAVPQLHYGNSSVLDLSQRLWPGFLPGSNIQPFQGPVSEDLSSLGEGRGGTNSLLNLSILPNDRKPIDSFVDNDVPLNLCKKSRPS